MEQLAEALIHYCNISVPRCRRIHFDRIDYFDLTFVLEGTLLYYADGERIELASGDGMLLPPGTLRSREAGTDPVRYVSFNFFSSEGALLDFPRYLPQCVTNEMTVAMMNFPTSHVAPSPYSRAKCLQMLNYILLCLLDGMQKETQNGHVIKMLCYIDARLTEKMSLGEISSHVGLSNEYASALFRREMHKTITDYIAEQRLLLAKGMILGGEMSLAEVAQLVGYENYNYFSRSFKSFFGISPMQMKQSRT